MDTIRLAIVGYGKIARDQHHPAIDANPAYRLSAVASRNAAVPGVAHFETLEALLKEGPTVDAVALCTPAGVRTAQARLAMSHGKHVMLEKPPGATLAEIETLREDAARSGVTLFASWHSRHAHCVAPARRWLSTRKIQRVDIEWKEDVREWHPGQAWIWQPGGMGVFDPGINALSIATAILPRPFHLIDAQLQVPGNCQTPIAASLDFVDGLKVPIHAEFDFRQVGTPPIWEIHVETDDGRLTLEAGGSRMRVDGELLEEGPDAEYAGLYERFAGLIGRGQSDVDVSPFRHVADALMLGYRHSVEDFIE
ncbi:MULTISPECIES: Gfo/Idh/MocA family protein [Salinicola]|uniref:Gfo/Idh/MocA family oxidoreductase n=1 Tax=Salinicola endophyticus TaxID=1949083 RepID=A0AB74UHP0_9GAMM|nr:Gfo/Idh/MocA family oxidoreductase [Salinicola sp. JS01]KFF48499.1 galactose 1-dehydrogenase [Gammaproteobacteria bacterium MFB021]WIX33873.1 Gfo/Idh/MocA family oxidoreductase [Salinicola sp. JS01]